MNQINDIQEWQKKLAEFRHSVEIVHVWKESGITTQGLNELFFIWTIKINTNFLLANADLL